MIDCRTHIGFGAPTKQDTKAAHGSPLGAGGDRQGPRDSTAGRIRRSRCRTRSSREWREIGGRGAAAREAWEARLGKLSGAKQAEFARIMAGEMPAKLAGAINAFKKAQSEAAAKVATRKSSELVLEVVNAVVPETMGGSADLTGSNNTLTKGLGVFDAENRGGRYVHYGIREHGMAAAMNGMAVHGGVVPYGGTFLCFADYARGRDAAVVGDGRAGDLRADPQLDRARRGRADAPAGRASGDAAGDAEPQRLPARGHGGDGGGLGAGADQRRHAVGAGADPAEPAGAADQAYRGRT